MELGGRRDVQDAGPAGVATVDGLDCHTAHCSTPGGVIDDWIGFYKTQYSRKALKVKVLAEAFALAA